MRKALSLVLLIGLAGCGTQVAGIQTMPVPQNPQQAVFEAETNFDAAIHQATLVPLCTSTITTLCVTGPQMAQIYSYATQATEALNQAKSAATVYSASPTTTNEQKAMEAAQAVEVIASQIVAILPKGK